MAWIFFQDTAELKTHFGDLSVPLPIAKLSEELSAFFCRGCEKATLASRLYGRMCPLCGKSILLSKSTSSLAVSRARMSALLECEEAWMESEADYFSRSLGLYASFDPNSFTWKMSQGCLFEGWTESAQSWPAYSMTIGLECFQLSTWERRTSESESGFLLPTPSAQDSGGYNKSASSGAQIRYGLEGLARRNLLPTPQARDFKDGLNPRRHGMHSPSVAVAVAVAEQGFQGYLNPQFVEAMMGLPIDATELEPWATDGFRKQREKRSSDLLEEI